VFQPVADLTTGSVVGVEALARFGCQPHRPPNVWFGEAEHLGRGTELELAAIRAALDRMPELRPDLFMAVNVSPATAAAEELALLLDRYPSHRVVLELTEHTRVDDYDGLLAALDRLRRRGIRIAVDDTGAGYAGLQHLLRIHPHMLKLDTALTHGIDHDPVRRSLAAALVTFALETGATIIAEASRPPGARHAPAARDPVGTGLPPGPARRDAAGPPVADARVPERARLIRSRSPGGADGCPRRAEWRCRGA
jgi:EAL domain-containing protein (putative c-di-GMP-specific phosphodiesterase class I)